MLTNKDYQKAAKQLGVTVAHIKAVAEVEAPKGAFLPTGEPTLLFERHIFHRETKGRYSRSYPDISSPSPGGYGAVSRQHARLQKAAALDRPAALRSASWGRFQIMGFNHVAAGFDTLQKFINAMYRSEASQLAAFVQFLKSENLDVHLRNNDWAKFARGYNGPAYAKHNYHGRLAAAFKKHGGMTCSG